MREKDKVKGKGVRLRKKGLRWLEKQDYITADQTRVKLTKICVKPRKKAAFPLYLPSAHYLHYSRIQPGTTTTTYNHTSTVPRAEGRTVK